MKITNDIQDPVKNLSNNVAPDTTKSAWRPLTELGKIEEEKKNWTPLDKLNETPGSPAKGWKSLNSLSNTYVNPTPKTPENEIEIDPIRRKEKMSERKKEMDLELENLRTEKKDLTEKLNAELRMASQTGIAVDASFQKLQDRINEIDQRMSSVSMERLEVSKRANPITEEESKELSLATKFNTDERGFLTNDFKSALQKYGMNKIRDFQNDDWTKELTRQEKGSVETSQQITMPEGMFTYAALKHVDKININEDEKDKLLEVYKKMTEGGEWNGHGLKIPINREGRVKVALKTIQNYVDKTMPEAEADLKKKKVFEYSKLFNAMMSFDPKNGTPSVEGLQSFAVNQHAYITERFGEMAIRRAELKELREAGKLNGQEEYLQYIENEMNTLNALKQFNEKILSIPVKRSGASDVWGAFTKEGAIGSKSMADIATLGVREVKRLLEAKHVTERLEAGEQLTWGEQKLLETYSALMAAEGKGTKGVLYQGLGGVVDMIPYFATFGATSKLIYSPVRKGVASVITKALPKSLVAKSAIKLGPTASKVLAMNEINLLKGATQWTARGLGSLGQAAAVPQMTEAFATRREIPEMRSEWDKGMHNIVTTLDKNTGESRGEALAKGFAQTWMNMGFEHSGDYLMKLTKMPTRLTAGILNRPLSKDMMADNAIKLFGYKSWDQMHDKIVKKGLGWDGFLNEYYEELGTQIAEAVVTGDGIEKEGFLEQQLVTALTLGIVHNVQRGISKGVKYAMFGPIGDDIAYITKDSKGKKSKVIIPQQVHTELMDIFSEGTLIDGEKIDALFNKYANNPDSNIKLDEKQVKFIIDLAMQEGEKKFQRALVIEALQKNGVNVEEAMSETETGEEIDGDLEKVGRSDVDKIVKKNEKFKKKYPELYNEGLLPQAKTGQFVEPTAEYLLSLKEQLDEEVNTLSAKREENRSDLQIQVDVARAIKQRDIVNSHLDKIADNASVPFNYRLPSEKHSIITKKLQDGEKVEGKGTLITDTKMLVTLPGGDQVNVFLGPQPGINETPEQYKERTILAQKASRKDLPLEFRLVAKEDWNADNKAFEKILNEYTGMEENIPYGDRIEVLSEGKMIGAVQIHNWNEQGIRANKYRKAIEMSNRVTEDMVHDLQISPESSETPEQRKERLDKKLKNLLFDLNRNMEIDISETIPWLKNQITKNKKLSEQDKMDLFKMIDSSNALEHVTAEKLKLAGFKTKDVPFSIIEFESTEAVSLTSAMKLSDNLKTFFPLWKQIGEANDIARERVEMEFHSMVTDPSVQSVTNEATYVEWMLSQRNVNSLRSIISETLLQRNESGNLVISFEKMLSAFNFYSNAKLIKQYGMIFDKKGPRMVDLNPPQSYAEFLNIFFDRYSELGPEGVRNKILKHYNETETFFANEWRLTEEGRAELKKAQFEKDLLFLRDITGVDAEKWRSYFKEQTGETMQFATKETTVKVNFGTWENVLNKDAFRPNSNNPGNGYHLRQSNLMFNLILLKKYRDDKEFSEKFVDYFTKSKGSSENNNLVFSNLFKLSTSEEEIGPNGQDVKGDNFSSFQQMSDLYWTADNILTSVVDNPLVNYYKAIGKPMQIVIVNGIHNRANYDSKHKKGVTSTSMSMEDIWTTLMYNFANGKDTYLQNVGQFADKPYVYLTQVPKVLMPTPEQMEYANTLMGGKFKEAVSELITEVARYNDELFKELAKGYPARVTAEQDYIANKNDRIANFVAAFVYNYAVNQNDINEIIFGYTESNHPGYKSLKDMFKRAGSTNSPGYRLNTNVVGGVGKTFKFAVVNDKKIFDELGKFLTKNGMDGCVFYSDAVGKKMQVSSGSLYAKEDKYPVMTTTKALMSWKNKITNRRGLMKGNWYNIETMAKDTDSETYIAIRDFMKQHKIDVLGIGTASSVKILDEGQVVNLFDPETGKLNQNVAFDPAVNMMEKSWDDVFVQQDLRHSMTPKVSKAPTQNFTTMLSLDNGFRISGLVMELQRLGLEKLSAEFNSKEPDESKRDWLLENINEFSQRDLLNLVRMGLTVDDPVYRNMMRKIMSSAVNRKALEIPINRTVTIEIPDLDRMLQPMRKVTFNGVEKTMLAEAAASVPGARIHDPKFEGKVEEAIEYVKKHQEKYRDLFDEAGNLMEWEIRGRNGVIPGEVIFLTRVPNSGFSTFDVARLKVNFKSGNYAMINREGQIASSSDFDGDQRYVQSAFKREGLLFYDETQEGIANQIMRLVIQDYTNPKFFDRIRYIIDTNAYDSIIEGIKFPDFLSTDPRAFQDARLNNKVGLDMKGGMTNLLTVYSLISRYNIPFKKKRKVEHQEKGFWLTGVARDEYGAIRAHMENFLTMFFDNQKDPKVEKMGFNEITGNMFILMLIGNEYNGSDATHQDGKKKFNNFDDHYKAIKKSIGDQVGYFTSPLMKFFVKEMRRENGGMRTKDANKVFKTLMRYAKRGAAFTTTDVENLRTLFFYSRELSDIKALHSLTQEAPNTYSELLIAERLVAKAKGNSEQTFKLFDLRNILDEQGNFIPEFRAIDMVLDFSRNFIFDDVVENTTLGRQIYAYIFPKLAEAELAKKTKDADEDEFITEKKNFTQEEMDAINSAINNVFNIRAIGLNQSIGRTTMQLGVQYDKYKESMPGNLFLNFVEKTEDGQFQIKSEYRKTKIHDNILDKIREDFDKLPDDLKDLFSTYQIEKYGSSVSTTNGGFYLLFGNEYKVELSRRAREEMDNWYFDTIPPLEKLAVAQWVIRSSRMFSIRNLQEFTDRDDRLVDYYTEPTVLTPLHRDTLEAIESYDDIQNPGFAAYKPFVTQVMLDWAKQNYPVTDPLAASAPYKNIIHPYVKQFMAKKRALAEQYFPTHEEMTDQDIKDFYTGNAEMQMMLSFDEGLNNFIYNHLKEQFPNVEFFNDIDAFTQFVRRNIGRTIDINLQAVGHAFKNAVYIDPTRPVQEAMFHEHAHIYWDALPADNDVKMKLLELYSTIPLYKGATGKVLEEFIIRDIGRAGTDFAQSYMNASFLEKFQMYLKDFWTAVKIAFGKYDKTDLVNKMVYSIWTNRGKVGTNSRLGDAQINDLVLNDEQANDIVREDQQFMCKIGDVRVPGITTVIDRFKYDKFDSEKTLQQNINAFEKYWKDRTGKEPTDEDVFSYSQYVANQWSDRTNAGNTIHLMAREVFSGIPMSPTIHTLNFNTGVASQLRDSFMKLKLEILEKHPNAKFYTEQPLVSIKNKVFGYADLIVDIGDNHLLLFDFKSTEREYKNEDGTLSDYYRREFSFMLPPLTKIKQSKEVTHRLQLSIEAMILEEQENPDNPDEKNVVDGIYVVPIITKIDGRQISEAHISETVVGSTSPSGVTYPASVMENLIKMDPLKNIAEEMLQKYHNSTLNLNDMYMQLKDELEAEKIPFPVANKMLEAYAYLSANSYQNLDVIDHHGISAIRGNGFRGMYNKLMALGFTALDINGDPIAKVDPIPVEALLHIVKNNMTRAQWEAEKGTWFKEVSIEANLVQKLNPRYTAGGNGYYHQNFRGEDYYFHDAGFETLSEGDEVIAIDEINYGGHVTFNHEIYKVDKILKRGKTVILENVDSHVKIKVSGLEKTEGLLKLDRQQNPALHTGTNNYAQKWISVKDHIMEKHWKDPNPTESSFGDTAEAAKNWQRHMMSKKILYKFYRKYNNKKKLFEVLDDIDVLTEYYHDLLRVSGEQIEISKALMTLLEEEINNHIMASQIREENKNGPSAYMPMTLNIYKIISYDSKAVFTSFSGWNKAAYWWAPTRKIQADNPGLTWVLGGIEESLLRIQKEQYDLGKKIKPYLNSLDHTRLVEKIGSQYEWRLPSDPYVTEREAMFLKIIYDHYYSREAKYIEYGKKHLSEGKNFDEHGFPRRIRVTRLHATRHEMIQKLGKRLGSKWGGIIYDIMSETTYDNIKFDVGNKKIMTLGEIKETFAIENANDDEINEWLGPRIQYWFMSVPFARNFMIRKGKLYNYVKEARKIYENGDKLNPPAKKSGKSVTPIKDTAVRYKTDHIIEAEAKVMDSNIFAYYMKEMIAPIEFVLANYKEIDTPYKYLKEYTDLLVYKKSTKMGSEATALLDKLQELTSLRFISYSLTTQGYNLSIGQAQNIVRELPAYGKGLKRIMSNPTKNAVKAINILRSYGLGNIVDEAYFDTLAKRAGVDFKWKDKSTNISYESFKTLGYFPMELVERINQIPVFAGLMTQEEWDSYEVSGALIKGKTGLTTSRAANLSRRVRDVQGDYTPKYAAPFWNTPIGSALFMFTKWAPTLIDSNIMPYHFDDKYMVRSGILPTVALATKIFIFKTFKNPSEKARYEYLRKALLRWPDTNKVASYNKWVDKTFSSEKERKEKRIDLNNLEPSIKAKQSEYLHGVSDYMKMLSVASREGRITYKQLNDQDIRNLLSAGIKVVMFLAIQSYLARQRRKSKLEVALEDNWDLFFEKMATRLQSDMFVFLGQAKTATGMQYGGWTLQKLQKPVPALDYLVSGVKLMTDSFLAIGDVATHIGPALMDSEEALKEWWKPDVAYFSKTTATAMEGDAKWWHDLLTLLPASGAIRDLLKYRVASKTKQEYLSYLKDSGFDEKMIMDLEDLIADKSLKDLHDFAMKYTAIREAQKAYLLYEMTKGNMVLYRNIIQGKKVIDEETRFMKDALRGLLYLKDSQIDEKKLETIINGAKKFEEFQNKGKNQSDREKMRKFNESMEFMKQNPGYYNLDDSLKAEVKSNIDIRKPIEPEKESFWSKLKTKK